MVALVGGEGAVVSREFPMSAEQSPLHRDQARAAPPSPKRLFDPHEASIYLRIAKQTLARWRCYGLGPRFVRIGGRIFYDAVDLDAFIAGNKFRSTAEADQAAYSPARSRRGKVRPMSGDMMTQFVAAMREHGLEPVEEIIADGKLHRVRWQLTSPAPAMAPTFCI